MGTTSVQTQRPQPSCFREKARISMASVTQLNFPMSANRIQMHREAKWEWYLLPGKNKR